MFRRRGAGFVAGAALALAACGGGGGAGGGPGGNAGGGGVPTAAASGRVTFDRGPLGTLSEAEPNDSVSQVHTLGILRAGQSITVAGTLGADGDVFDGFQVRALQRLRVTATLTTSNPAAAEFELALYDPVSLQFVEDFAAAGSPETGVFYAKGPFDLVVRRTSGQGPYFLRLVADAAPSTFLEREPNGLPTEAQSIGEVVVGDVATVQGSASTATDAYESVVFPAPIAMRLHVEVTAPAFQNFDLEVLDATAGLGATTLLAGFSSPTANPETGDVSLAAGRLVVVRVHAVTGAGAWALALRGDPAVGGTAAAPAGPRTAPLDAEGAVLRRAVEPGRSFGVPDAEFRPGEALVAFTPATESEVRAEIAARGGRIEDRVPGNYVRVHFDDLAALPEEEARRETVSRLARTTASSVRWAELDRLSHATSTIPDDSLYNEQWDLEQIRCPEAWDLTTGSPSVVVAVIDSGWTEHPELVPNYIGGYDFISDKFSAQDGNGMDPDPFDASAGYHGTHVAGTICASGNNGTGVAGIAWNVKLLVCRVLGRGGAGAAADVADAIRYAAGLPNASGTLPPQRADVINLSLGQDTSSQVLADACWDAHNAGTVICAAAGNTHASKLFYPAADAGVIAVMSVGYDATRAPYSNYGFWVDLAAPGGDTDVDRDFDGHPDGILSTFVDRVGFTYASLEGTSMACPHVAGVVALVRSVAPTLTADQVEALLESTAKDLGVQGKDLTYGWGLVDAYAAVKGALPPDPKPPELSVGPLTLNFGAVDTSLQVGLFNLGDPTVTVSAVTASTQDGGTWLSAVPVSGTGGINVSRVDVSVDRAGLPEGTYFGKIDVTSDAGSASVDVYMTVLFAPPPLPDVQMRVQAIRVDTGLVVQTVPVNPLAVLTFSFHTLPAGSYTFVCGSDFDGDGVIGELGDYYGVYGTEGQPTVVDLPGGTSVLNLDFRVAVRDSFGQGPPK